MRWKLNKTHNFFLECNSMQFFLFTISLLIFRMLPLSNSDNNSSFYKIFCFLYWYFPCNLWISNVRKMIPQSISWTCVLCCWLFSLDTPIFNILIILNRKNRYTSVDRIRKCKCSPENTMVWIVKYGNNSWNFPRASKVKHRKKSVYIWLYCVIPTKMFHIVAIAFANEFASFNDFFSSFYRCCLPENSIPHKFAQTFICLNFTDFRL